MRARSIPRSIRCALWGIVLLLSPATVLAQLEAGTICGANFESEPGPRTATTSTCEMHRSFPDALDPAIVHQGTGTGASQVSYGVLRARASAVSDGGEASAFSFAEVNSGFSVQSADESRFGEEVYVTFGAHRVDARTQREAVVPRPDGDIAFEYSFAATTLRYEFDMFTTLSGSTLRWAWSDDALERNGAGTENDLSSHDVTGALTPMVVPMFLGEIASFRLTLSARSDVQGTGHALVDAFQSAYWGGITGVVDAAGRPVDYVVRSPDGADWGRSHIPDLATPVPEPGSGLLLGMGVAMLVIGGRRWRRPPAAPL
jgi:hypothetical protein